MEGTAGVGEKSRLKAGTAGPTGGMCSPSICAVAWETGKADKRAGLGAPTFKGVETALPTTFREMKVQSEEGPKDTVSHRQVA